MKRREVITLLGGAAVWPLTARAQQQQRRAARIGYLSAASAPDVNIESFKEGMRRFGYVEDRDFIIEVRYAERNFARFPTLIEDLLRARVELIVTAGPATQAAPIVARSVPVVFGFSGNPVDAGVVASFARPSANATGVSFLALDLAAKRVEILRESAPPFDESRCCRTLSMRASRLNWRSLARRRGSLDSRPLILRYEPTAILSGPSVPSQEATATPYWRFPTP
jgi:putative ABC transport system substrate-binding protein